MSKTLGPITFTDTDGRYRVLFAARVPPEHHGDPRAVATANLLQREIVGKRLEYRVTVVANRLFTTELHARGDYLDIRDVSEDRLVYKPGELPDHVAAKVLAVTAGFGLAFAAWDLLLDRDGRTVALELNPAGQWAFCPNHGDVTRAIADHLEEATTR